MCLKQESQYLHTSLEEVNSTLMLYQKLNDLKLLSMDSTISNLSWRVTSLENHMTLHVNTLEKRENLTTGVVSLQAFWKLISQSKGVCCVARSYGIQYVNRCEEA